jgi:hypothetical protein
VSAAREDFVVCTKELTADALLDKTNNEYSWA